MSLSTKQIRNRGSNSKISKYKNMYKKSVKLKQIREAMEKGSGIFNACKYAGISYRQMKNWCEKRSIIDDYIKHLMNEQDKQVENALFINATKENNVTAQIFWLKNRIDRWRETPLVDQSQHQHLTIVWKQADGKEKEHIPTERNTIGGHIEED